VADDVVGEGRVEGDGREARRLRDVTLLEVGKWREFIDRGESPGTGDGAGVEVEPGDVTADAAREVEGVEA
jgi:hypothetical protein